MGGELEYLASFCCDSVFSHKDRAKPSRSGRGLVRTERVFWTTSQNPLQHMPMDGRKRKRSHANGSPESLVGGTQTAGRYNLSRTILAESTSGASIAFGCVPGHLMAAGLVQQFNKLAHLSEWLKFSLPPWPTLSPLGFFFKKEIRCGASQLEPVKPRQVQRQKEREIPEINFFNKSNGSKTPRGFGRHLIRKQGKKLIRTKPGQAG